MKFGQYILRKINKTVATKLKCTQFDFSWGSVPISCWGSLQRSSRPLAGF